MPRKHLSLILAVALTATLALAAHAERPVEGPVGDDVATLVADGWTEVAPGAWEKSETNGITRLHASTREGIVSVLGILQQEAAALLDDDLTSPVQSRRFATLLSQIAVIERDLATFPADRETAAATAHDCAGRKTYAWARTGHDPDTCGVEASASAGVKTSYPYPPCYDCTVWAEVLVEGSCSSSGGLVTTTDTCEQTGQNVSCTASDTMARPFQCEALAGATVYCPGDWEFDKAAYDDTFGCNPESGLLCVC